MRDGIDESIARSFGTHPVLMPVIDDLLRDVALLGFPVDPVIGLLRPLKLKGARTVLDLGCGKGTLAAALARELDLNVTGVDAHAPFLVEARQRAKFMGVTDTGNGGVAPSVAPNADPTNGDAAPVHGRCRFVESDIRLLAGRLPAVDVVLFLACRDIFGHVRETVAALRRLVHSGGFMVLDHDYALKTDGAAVDALDHEALVAALTAAGDRIVMEKHGRSHETMELANASIRAVERRARELLRTYPGVAGTVWEWIETERRAIALHATGGPLIPSIWVLQRSDS